MVNTEIIKIYKKVLLRERKRHTARRVAIAIFLLLWVGGGGSLNKNFFSPVWTCIKPNLLSKIFPFTKTRYPPPPKIWDQVPPPPPENLRPGTPPPENLRPGYPPPRKSETRSPPWNLRPGTPLPKIWDQVPPPRNVNRQTPVKTVPSRHTTYAGGKNTKCEH